MSESEKYFQDYLAYSRDLKVWLIAYGIGAPVLFVSKEEIYEKVLAASEGKLIVILFLAGVSLQIFESIISKWCSWIQYSNKIDKQHRQLRLYTDWWFDHIAPRLIIEITSVVTLVLATFLTFGVLANA